MRSKLIPKRISTLILIWTIAISIVLGFGSSSSWAAPLAQIEERGTLIVAVKENVRPMGFRDANGQLQGLEIDIARRLALELLGSEDAVEFQPVKNSERLWVAIDDRVDLVVASVTATEARDRVVSFSLPYYLDGVALVTLDPQLAELASFQTQTIAVLNGSSTIAALRYFLPQAQLVGVESYAEAKGLMDGSQVNAFAGDASVLAGWVQEFPEYRLLPFQLSTEPLCVVMPEGLQYDELRRRVATAIEQWRSDGWLRERATVWGLPVPAESASDLQSSDDPPGLTLHFFKLIGSNGLTHFYG
jgi:polar amino acid transport system substrate-binding protein